MAYYDTAMILAAGRGERMRPLTDSLPKPLLCANGVPLISYHLQKLQAAGIRRVVVNHAWLGHEIERFFASQPFAGEVILSAEGESGLETAGGIINALPLLDRERFIVVNGDVYSDFDYATLPELSGLGHLVLVANPEHHLSGDFVLSEDGKVQSKQANHTSLTFSGIACYHRDLFTGLSNEKRPLRPVFERAIAHSQLTGQHFKGYWCDVGTVARLTALSTRLAAESHR